MGTLGLIGVSAVVAARFPKRRKLLALLVIIGAAAGALPLALASSAVEAVIRVDQLGYAADGTKVAYLMSSAPEAGAKYSVRLADGTVAVSAPVGNSVRSWSSSFPYVYSLDFSQLTAPGTYTISLAGSAPMSSPAFPVESPTTVFQSALGNALAFYRTERDGPNYIRSPLRTAPGHLNDRHARTYLPPRTDSNGYFRGKLTALPRWIDASGGWWDAGDYLKFVQTTSYTVDTMLVGIRDFPDSMGARSQGSDFTDEARFGLNWLLHMWDDRTRTMYFQVGIGEGNSSTVADHDIWRLPQADDHYAAGSRQYRYIRHRPVFRAGRPGSLISPNLAGRDAAAFALCFQVFRYQAPAFADRCLRAGEHVFALADLHPRHLTTVIPYGFYPETEWRDDMELGATELADALAGGPLPRGLAHTSSLYYLRQATWWARAYQHQADAGDTLNLYDVSGLADYELYRAIARAGNPVGLWIDRSGLLADMGRQLGAAIDQAESDPFGSGYAWSSSDTVSHLAGLSVMASEYTALTGDARYRAWSTRWLDNILGANPWGASFIIGDGSAFPQCPQHQVANLTGLPLAGGAVEGPTTSATAGLVQNMRRCPSSGVDRFKRFNGRGAVFKDNVQSYSTDEPAIDLTATSPLAFAWQVGR